MKYRLDMNNIFSNFPDSLPEEITEILLESENVRIERIVSSGHASPQEFWYEQNENEWVVVVKGRAKLRFEDDEHLLEMGPGDCLNIPAKRRHRVEWTTPDEPTLWLAVFY
jgi:cupin 2 domain-containing protein